MTPSNYQVRRATIDDLAALRRLWQQAGLEAGPLERRLTEFQVAETAQGEVLGAIGLQLAGSQARLHTETYRHPENAAELRARLWERVQSIARNHGLTRLWVQNRAALFWLEQGFEPAGSAVLKILPESLAEGAEWLTLQLREETAASTLVEQELALFRQSQQEQSERIAWHTRLMRVVAGVISAGLLAMLGFGLWRLLQHMKGPPGL